MNPLQSINRVATGFLLFGFLCFLAVLVQLVVWGADRRVPFALVEYAAPATRAGEAVVIHSRVDRALNRSCSVQYSRMFFDSGGARYDLTQGAQIMNAAALSDLNRRTPDTLVISVTIPKYASPGVGSVVTVLNYVCNPVHQIYPVEVLLSMDVVVKP